MVKCLDLIRMADIRSRWIDHVTDSLAWSCSRFAVVPFEYALAVLINLIAILVLVLGAADDLLVSALLVGADGGQFEAVERALAGQRLAPVAPPLADLAGGVGLASPV